MASINLLIGYLFDLCTFDRHKIDFITTRYIIGRWKNVGFRNIMLSIHSLCLMGNCMLFNAMAHFDVTNFL